MISFFPFLLLGKSHEHMKTRSCIKSMFNYFLRKNCMFNFILPGIFFVIYK
jgi:hypothetical protein